MKTIKQVLAGAFIATAFGTIALAQEGAPEGEGAPSEELAVLPQFEAVDANQDGMIDQTETEALAEVLADEHEIAFEFESVDQSQDGVIDSQEYIAYDFALREQLGIA
jgi:hypothetical protein